MELVSQSVSWFDSVIIDNVNRKHSKALCEFEYMYKMYRELTKNTENCRIRIN